MSLHYWGHTNYPEDWFWDRDSSWDRTSGSWDYREAFSPPQKTRNITTLGWKHPVPLSDRREILINLIKQVQEKVCPNDTIPVIWIHAWSAQLVQAILYTLCCLQPDFSAKGFFDKDNNFDKDHAVKLLLEAFYANYKSEQAQAHVIKFVMSHATKDKEAMVIDNACDQGFNLSLVEDKVSGSARHEARSGFPNALRPIPSPQGRSMIELDEEYQRFQKEKHITDTQVGLLKRNRELQEYIKTEKYLKHDHVPQAITASITEATPSLAARQANVQQIVKEAIQSLCMGMTKYAQETINAKDNIHLTFTEAPSQATSMAQMMPNLKQAPSQAKSMVQDLQENQTSKQAVAQLQTHPEADLGNAQETQDQHKGQQQATSFRVATTVVNKLPEAQAQLVAQENETPNQAVIEFQTQADATTPMVAQTDEAQAQAEGQQQERQARILQATLSGDSDDTLGCNMYDPSSGDTRE